VVDRIPAAADLFKRFKKICAAARHERAVRR
jgi:hypothetical protein